MAEPSLCASRERINNTQDQRTFRHAAESYIEHGGEARYVDRIVEHFGDLPLRSIFPFDIRQMAETLYPWHSGATRNRQAITPARAVILHAYDRGWCDLMRVRRFKADKPVRLKAASPIWLHAFTRQCDRDRLPHVAAMVLFMATTAARVSEAVALEWPQVDLVGRTALLLRTKTSTNSMRHLTDEVAARLRDLHAANGRTERVFRYTCRHSVNERIKAVCARAEIPNKPPHTCGRRTFATRAIDLGMDIRTAMTAGGWESSTVFLETYVQPRFNAGRMVADRFAQDDFGAM